VNNPQLLPATPNLPVVDVAGFLSKGQVERLSRQVLALERDTGIKLRVLSQAYPNTPGLAVKEYWGVDADTVVFVADPNTGNILNFNVGANVDLTVPRAFWSRLAGKYGAKSFWQNAGEEAAVEKAVLAIDACLRAPNGRGPCVNIID